MTKEAITGETRFTALEKQLSQKEKATGRQLSFL
jgi:hypothetical protein